MIMSLSKNQHKLTYIIAHVNKWFNILSEVLIQRYLHMGKLEVEKLIQCLEIYKIKKIKE